VTLERRDPRKIQDKDFRKSKEDLCLRGKYYWRKITLFLFLSFYDIIGDIIYT